MGESLVMLHGFAGTSRAWDAVAARVRAERYLPLALDLPGHGRTAERAGAITFAACTASVLARGPDRFALCGYSMGGRIALHVALAAPERVQRLVLVSTTAGISDDAERARRRAYDQRLADELEQASIEQFIGRWREHPLFAEDPPEVSRLASADQRRNHPQALAAVLRGIGTGEMEPLWDRLDELRMPATVLAGDRDGRYRALAERMVDLLGNAELVVVEGGHRLLLESPRAVAGALIGRKRSPEPQRRR